MLDADSPHSYTALESLPNHFSTARSRLTVLQAGRNRASANLTNENQSDSTCPTMEIVVNGQAQRLSSGSSVADLLKHLEAQPRYVAVERNLQIVPRADHTACILQPGDRLEIVTLVGGG